MDRVNGQTVPLERLEGPTSEWNSHAVWRERIHAPRHAKANAGPALASLLDASAGWDPLETWRIRVQRPRLAQG